MKTFLKGSVCALPALIIAHPVLAQSEAPGPENDPIVVSGEVATYPASGLMNEHTHDGGEFMFAIRYMKQESVGANVSGTDKLSDAEVLAAGYTVRAKSMIMDMVMLDIMYAPNDTITLMVMPHWMRHEMTMVGIDPAITGMMDMDMGGMDGAMGHAHHALAFGQTMTHSTEGFSDTLVSASYRLVNTPALRAHATLGLWVPTGKADRMNANGTFVHYGMQSGSGTWDIEPSVTVAGYAGDLGWGMQASYRWRTDDSNSSGFAFGDEAKASIWASYRPSPIASVTGRLGWEHEGQILGHYNGAHNHAAPPDRQENYGGDVLLAALGANLALPFVEGGNTQIGVEAGVPIYQDLNGIQLPEQWRLGVTLSNTF